MDDAMKLKEDLGHAEATQAGLRALLDKIGVAESDLRPAGVVTIDGERVDVVTEGEMIPEGATVRVIEVEGNRCVVESVR